MWAVVVIAVIAIAAVLVVALTAKTPKVDDMGPLGLDKFQITQCDEGQCIPWVWGTIKMTSNILWFGNLTSTEVKASGGGGKGGGGGSSITGYRYKMDMWLGLLWSPHGGIEIKTVYAQDKEIGLVGLGSYTLNVGNGSYFPTEPGVLANRLHGQSHIFLDQFDLGENTGFVPNLSFVIKNTSSCTLLHSNMVNGINPAAIIWDLLIASGVALSQIDTASFQEAANYWYTKGYGLNIIMNSQRFVDEAIAQLLSYVDFTIYQDNEGLWFLKAYRNVDAAVATLNTDDFKNFQFIRNSWDNTSNDFRANYIDEDRDFTQRVIAVDNISSINQVGSRIQKSIDLTAFNQIDTACKRLTELMKIMSYPGSGIQCDVPYRFITLRVGDVVAVNNTEYNLVNGQYRVVSIDEADDNNYIKLSLSQKMEDLFNDTYATGGGGSWVPPDTEPRTLAHQDMFPLPYTETYSTLPAHLCLAQRKGAETGFAVYSSPTAGGSYKFIKNLTSFSTQCVLNDDYLAGTDYYSLDDDVGILLTPHRFDPEWTSISRAELFNTSRVLICENEIMTFQSIVVEGGGGAYRLKGVCRGALGTAVENHLAGTVIWIAEIGEGNVLTGLGIFVQYYKFVPYLDKKIVDVTSCTPIVTDNTLKTLTPLPAGRIVAVRGASIDVVVQPAVYNAGLVQNSAGAKDATLQSDKSPPDVYGLLEYNYSGSWISLTAGDVDFNYSSAGSHTLKVRFNWNGIIGPEKTLTVGASVGTYYGPDN